LRAKKRDFYEPGFCSLWHRPLRRTLVLQGLRVSNHELRAYNSPIAQSLKVPNLEVSDTTEAS